MYSPEDENSTEIQLDFFGGRRSTALPAVPGSSPAARDLETDPCRSARARSPPSQRSVQQPLRLPAVPCNQEKFSDKEVSALREGMFEDLNLLFDGRGSIEQQRDLLLWVAQPLRRPLTRAWVFSFQVCCIEYGWDPDYIRQGILRRFEREWPVLLAASDEELWSDIDDAPEPHSPLGTAPHLA